MPIVYECIKHGNKIYIVVKDEMILYRDVDKNIFITSILNGSYKKSIQSYYADKTKTFMEHFEREYLIINHYNIQEFIDINVQEIL